MRGHIRSQETFICIDGWGWEHVVYGNLLIAEKHIYATPPKDIHKFQKCGKDSALTIIAIYQTSSTSVRVV